MIWQANTKLHGGKYTIVKVLAEGAFGTTYLALAQNNQKVVIKIPLEKYRNRADYDKVLKRLVNECQKFQKLKSHPHIVEFIEDFKEPYVEYGVTTEVYGVVTAFVEGKTLFKLIEELKTIGQQISEERAIAYVQEIGSALAFMHQNKQVHRDAQPNNIMIRADNTAILIDFGLAADLAIATNTYEHHGHQNFASVEQHEGGAEATVDIYTLASTLYFALTDEVPAKASDREKAQRHKQADPLIPLNRIRPDISGYLVEAIAKGMAIKAKDRSKTITAWLKLLEKPMTQPPQPKNSNSSSYSKTVKVLLKTVGFEENLSTQKVIPWAWLVWNITIYAAISGLFAALVVPRFLVLGLWILAFAWGLAIAGNWALQWASFLSLAWLVSSAIVVGTLLYGVANWLAIIYAIVLIGGAIVFLRSGDDLLKSLIRKWTTSWNKTSSDLRSSFSSIHSFWILAGANLFGIVLGRFLYGFLR
jgi:serine/threonine protein kinase